MGHDDSQASWAARKRYLPVIYIVRDFSVCKIIVRKPDKLWRIEASHNSSQFLFNPDGILIVNFLLLFTFIAQ